MAVNPVGYVCPFDGGNPRIISGKAIEAISGGQIVYFSGASQPVSSGVNSLADGDMLVATGGSGDQVNGIAIENAASGGCVGVQTRGVVIMTAEDTVTNGLTVICTGSDAVLAGVTAGHVMGRALTSAGSEGYALISLNNL